MRSLPARGAWIEIANNAVINTQAGRSPQGERGLKYKLPVVELVFYASLPARGAWIEINQMIDWRGDCYVAPRKGSVD